MNKVEKTSYPGWNKTEDWREVSSWMYENESDHFLLSSGSSGYVFQVRANHEWFALRWA